MEESERLAALGLVEAPVRGSHLTLLEPADKSAPLTDAQRYEMARRLNEVGPRLPRYVMNAAKQENAEMPKGKSVAAQAAPAAAQQAAPATDEVQRDFEKNQKEFAEHEAEKAKREKAKKAKEEKAEKEKAAARKALKKKDVRPKSDPKPAKGAKDAAPKKAGGIGNLICELLVKKQATEDILKKVKEKFPSSKTSPASIAWYRSRLREEGKLPKA